MTSEPIRRQRDLRLDFFRGLAMFIILIAHIPNNAWALWIPARFGPSDAAEMFVFCSGFASAIAFGSVFLERGPFLILSSQVVSRYLQTPTTSFLPTDRVSPGAMPFQAANWRVVTL